MPNNAETTRVPGTLHGFTLLEVLVAMVIVGTAVASLMSLMSGSVHNLRRAESATGALVKARTKMNQLLLVQQPALRPLPNGGVIAAESQSGAWDELSRWKASVQPPSDEQLKIGRAHV